MFRMFLTLVLVLVLSFIPSLNADKKGKDDVGIKKEIRREIDIYIYETRRKDHTVEFYSWIRDNDDGGDCEVDNAVPEICVGWLQSGAMYIENKERSDGKGMSGQTMVFVTVAEKDIHWVEGGAGKPVRIWFGKLDDDRWDGKMYIETPYKSTFKVRRKVNIKKE